MLCPDLPPSAAPRIASSAVGTRNVVTSSPSGTKRRISQRKPILALGGDDSALLTFESDLTNQHSIPDCADWFGVEHVTQAEPMRTPFPGLLLE